MASAKNTFAASVQPKSGRLYAVIQVKENGKTKSVWRTLGLPEGTSRTKVQKAFREVVAQFETEYAENLERSSRFGSTSSLRRGNFSERRSDQLHIVQKVSS